MPVTLRYQWNGRGYIRAAVFATVEEALAQAVHDTKVVGRPVMDIIDGVYDEPWNVVKPTVLVKSTEIVRLGGPKINQYPEPRSP